MSQLYKKMYTTLFNRMEDVLDYIECEMVNPETNGRNYTQEIFSKIQAALQECEDIYADSDEE